MFWVAAGRQADFEAVFATSGIWSEFLSQSQGFLRTELKRESVVERQYRVLDFWSTHLAFEAFRERFADKYERFSGWLSGEGLVEREQLVGTYYTDDLQRGDEDESVPA